jgi:inositol transport system substrate-binding protein
MTRIVRLVATACLCLPLFLTPGRAAAADKKLTIAFSFQDLETEFWVAGHKAIIETLQQRGFKVIEKNAAKDANRQLEQVKSVLAQKVDGIVIIPLDGEAAVTIGKLANQAGVPYGVFNRPPTNKEAKALVAVADNRKIAADAVEFMALEAKKAGRKVTPAIMVGDLGDPNAVQRRQGFMDVIAKYPDLWTGAPVEIPTKWDSNVALANLQSAVQANPNIDFLFTSSDFLFPVIKSVLAPLGKWTKSGDAKHVLLGGVDGDKTACGLIRDGYLDATGVQDLFFEAKLITDAITDAVKAGEKSPEKWMDDPGFALTRGNYAEKHMQMWGCKLLLEKKK